MLSKNHLAFALFALLALGTWVLGIPLTYATALAVLIGSMLPDIDTPTSYFGKATRPLSTWIYAKYGHRTLTHSLVFLTSVALVIFPLYAYAPEIAYALLIGIGSHLFLDACTLKGSALLWPLSNPFHVIPEHWLLKDGSSKETPIFAVLIVLNVALLGIISYGLAPYQVIPSFDTISEEYMDKCDGLGAENICIIGAYVCEDYCGLIKGPALGFYNNKLVVKDSERGYELVDYYSQGLSLEKFEGKPLQTKRVEFLDETLTFENLSGLSSVSGMLYGEITCDNPYKSYPVFKLESSHLELHHILLDDLMKRGCSGIVYEGYLEYKIR